jgi:hypothetical protein
MADRPRDLFAPADLGDSELEAPLQLVDRPAPAAPPSATLAELEPEHVINSPVRKPVTYKRPDGGVGTYMLWGLALLGLGVVVVFGARFLRGTVEGRAVAKPTAAAAAPAAPAAPVHWTAVSDGTSVLVTVEVQPRKGVRLLLDGAPLPSNPVSLPRGSKHTITAFAEGYAAADLDVTADVAKSVRLQLQRAGR